MSARGVEHDGGVGEPEPRRVARERPAVATDYEHFVRLLPELAVDDPTPSRERWEMAMAPDTLLFEEAGEVVGYAFLQVLHGTGYVRHVVVDPAHRGRGHGRTIMAVLARRFREAGCSEWCLNVKPENTTAVRLYKGVGMEERYVSTALRIDWSAAAGLPEPERAVTARRLEASEATAVEAAFGMVTGTLTAALAQAWKVVLRLVDPAAPEAARVGVASFDPHFPGAFPFRVGRPSYARALLDAMRANATPEHSFVGLVVEDDAALTRHLVEHGATVRMEILHFRGALSAAP